MYRWKEIIVRKAHSWAMLLYRSVRHNLELAPTAIIEIRNLVPLTEKDVRSAFTLDFSTVAENRGSS